MAEDVFPGHDPKKLHITRCSDAAFWPDATDLIWQLDRHGKLIPSTDIIIAACALQTSAVVMTSNSHFRHIDGLQLIAPPKEWFS